MCQPTDHVTRFFCVLSLFLRTQPPGLLTSRYFQLELLVDADQRLAHGDHFSEPQSRLYAEGIERKALVLLEEQ